MKIHKNTSQHAIVPLFAALLLLTGCISGSHNYTPPQSSSQSVTTNTKEVKKTKAEVWTVLVAGLSSDFFVINTIDKESGLISLSYSGDPEQYVEGGLVTYQVSNLRGKRVYQFPASRAFVQYEFTRNNELWFAERSLNLNGRINVIVNEFSPGQTRVTVNVRYILTQNLLFSTVLNKMTGKIPLRNSETIQFDTGGSGRNRAETLYQPSGLLELKVLDLIE